MATSIKYTVAGPCGSFETGRIYDFAQVISYESYAHKGVWHISFADASRGIRGNFEWKPLRESVYAEDMERVILARYDRGEFDYA